MTIESYKRGREVRLLADAMKQATAQTITNFRRMDEEKFTSALHDLYQTADEMQRFLTKTLNDREVKELPMQDEGDDVED